MSQPPPRMSWPVEAIEKDVAAELAGFRVEVLPEVDSTNSELMRRFRAHAAAGLTGAPAPTLLVAEQQSAGRGRQGRAWLSQRGDSLTFSLGLGLQPSDWSGLSLATGIAVAEGLDPGTGSEPLIALKWPNDLWLGGEHGERKLGGILVETAGGDSLRYVVIGIGINIRPLRLAPAFAGANRPAPMPPGWLQEISPGADAVGALFKVARPLVRALLEFERSGFAAFDQRFAKRDVLRGRSVQFSGPGEVESGTAHGVARNGALLVHTAAGMKEITSSEVSVRPARPGSAEGKPVPC
jgi:BirA family transcriptional regulator, biotin operon repressor / biotin---[acetyl-CoA-carboxylase] ligase